SNGVFIAHESFYNCTSLTNVTIPNGGNTIGDNAFYNCISLPAVTIPNSVTSIGHDAFSLCASLTSMTIPSSVTSIRAAALRACASLTNISVAAANPAYSSVDGVMFDKAQTTMVQFPNARRGSFVIPNSVTSIGEAAFQFSTSLTNVTIPG